MTLVAVVNLAGAKKRKVPLGVVETTVSQISMSLATFIQAPTKL